MSRTVIYDTAGRVNLLDEDGWETGKQVLVYLTVLEDIDTNYGADADGNRGVLKVESEIIKSWIDSDDIPKLTAAEATQAIETAERLFKEGSPLFVDK